MGAFFTNIQVATGPEGLDAVRAVLDADAGRDRMIAAAPGEKADRSVIVVPGARWLSVYDEASESQDDKVLDRVGKALSKALGAPAFSVLIHDSDVLKLALYEGGKRTDAYDSNPGYFTGRLTKAKPDKHVAAWRHLAKDGSDDALRAVFGGGELFAEAALPVLADVLGVDGERLSQGQRYLADGSFGPLPETAVVLGWRSAERPAWDTPAQGPPRLETQWEQAERIWGTKRPEGAVRDMEAALGGRAFVSATTMNAGGAGKGLVVEVTSDDVVVWTTAQLVLGNPKAAKWIEQPLVREGDAWIARFPDAALPPGQASAGTPTSPAAMMKAMEARFATQVHVNVIGQGARAGRTDVGVRLTPSEGTGTSERAGVVIRSTEGRPLRAPADISPLMLVPLADRSRLVALVVLEPTALARAGEVVAAVAKAFPADGKVAATRYPGPPRANGAFGTLAGLVGALTGASAPKHTTGAAKGFLDGKRWRDLLAGAVTDGNLVHATWVAEAESMESAADVFVGAGVIAPPDAVPAVALGVRGGTQGDEAALVAAIDGLARDGVVIQALVTRWGHAPGVDQTPYELACGVHAQCTTQRAWATRWLRGVGPGWLWLGKEIRAHADPAALAPTALGDAVRVEVRDVAAVEGALAAILPGPMDWQAGVARRYGR